MLAVTLPVDDLATENARLRLEVERLRILIEAAARRADTEAANLKAEMAAIRIVEQRYASLVENVPHILYAGTPGSGITFMSSKFTEFTGGAPESCLGHGWVQYVHPDDQQKVIASWTLALKTGMSRGVDLRIRNRDGAYELFHANGKSLKNDRGDIIEWFGALANISFLGERLGEIPA